MVVDKPADVADSFLYRGLSHRHALKKKKITHKHTHTPFNDMSQCLQSAGNTPKTLHKQLMVSFNKRAV